MPMPMSMPIPMRKNASSPSTTTTGTPRGLRLRRLTSAFKGSPRKNSMDSDDSTNDASGPGSTMDEMPTDKMSRGYLDKGLRSPLLSRPCHVYLRWQLASTLGPDFAASAQPPQ